MSIFSLKNKEIFLMALNEGIISAQIAVSVRKSGYKCGKVKNNNLCFQIDVDKLEKIYDKIYECTL